MEKKTKKELLEVINEKEKEIVELKKQAKQAEKYEQFEESAREIKILYDCFVAAGFSDKQAFELINSAIANSSKNVRCGR